MSMAPNNPFQDPQDEQGGAQSAPPKKSYKGCLIGCGIAGVICVMVCCGGGVALVQIGTSAMAGELQRQLAGDPVIVEHIGEIESFQFSWGGTIEESQKAAEQGGGESKVVFEIEGSKGSGRFIIESNSGGGPGEAILQMPDGTRHEIDLGSGTEMGADEMEDLEMELNELIDSGDLEVPAPAEAENN